jgi:hypothetical protein
MTRKTTQSNDAVVLRKRGCCGGKRGATEGLLGLRKVFYRYCENRNPKLRQYWKGGWHGLRICERQMYRQKETELNKLFWAFLNQR